LDYIFNKMNPYLIIDSHELPVNEENLKLKFLQAIIINDLKDN
jgi:hypothetical protein